MAKHSRLVGSAHLFLGCSLSLLLATACGSEGGGGGGGGDDEPSDLVCQTEISVSGTFTPPSAPDPALGCVPTGTWAVTTVVGQGTCAAADLADIKSSYTYVFTGTGKDTDVTYDGGSEGFVWNYHAGGNGECEGTFTHNRVISASQYSQVVLRPYFELAGTTLAGTGSLEIRNGSL